MPIIVREDTLGNPEESARRMFNILDEQGGQGCGKVTTKKFKDLLELFGMNMSYEEVNDLFHEYDEDFDGYLDDEEFVRMMIESGIESWKLKVEINDGSPTTININGARERGTKATRQ